jgi:uncharacterized secreted repeat protein (TIGR03808 family)
MLDRRNFLALAAPMVLIAPSARAAVPSHLGLNAAQFGVRPGSSDDQTKALQLAINQAARAHTPLVLAAGVYLTGTLKLPSGANISGARGATQLVFNGDTALISSKRAGNISLSDLTFDGGNIELPADGGLLNFVAATGLRITGCTVSGARGHGMVLEKCDGEISKCTFTGAANTALFSRDGLGLTIASNTIRDSGNGGIRVWQTKRRDDGSLIIDNRIDNTLANAGGTGQNGNAINVFQADNVIVRGNHINGAAFSAIRGNSASNIQIIGNNCRALDEVAIYSEFAFEAAVISDNIVDGAVVGISVTNFDVGGRLSTVSGNVIRNLAPKPGTATQGQGIGISVEADTAVNGNTIEKASHIGISAGFGRYLRDVAMTGNVVRTCGYGIGASVAAGAGSAVIFGNMISQSLSAAIVGTNFDKIVTGDLAKGGAEAYPQLTIEGNKVR